MFQRTNSASVMLPSSAVRGSRPQIPATPGARAGGRLALALLSLFAVFAACTLTDDNFHPLVVDAHPNLAADAGAAPPACPAGLECCAAVPCAAGRQCIEGACVVAPPESNADAGDCRGSECPLPENLAPSPQPSCADGVANAGETDSDCGGVCGSTCQAGQRCAANGDCETGLICSPRSGTCEAATCSDGARDGAELLVDCGGGACAGCPDGTACARNVDCQSGVCGASGSCAAASCRDGVKNGDEVDVDCGGSCVSCPTGRACSDPGDCQSGVCGVAGCGPGRAQCCQAAACNDHVRNGNESDVDCGGRCPECPTGGACGAAGDCQSGVCAAAGCAQGVARCCQAPSCSDGVSNGGEVGIDCGAGCGLCALNSQCAEDAQCQSGFCLAGRCTDPGSCSDGVRNGRETAVDCGGDRCPRCADRLPCTQASDCINNNCFNGVCISCGSGVIDGTETDIDCGGSDPACRRCNPGERCLIGSDCLSGVCFGGFC